MNYIPLNNPLEIRDGHRWHQGHKHFEMDYLSDDTIVLQSREKNKVIQLLIAPGKAPNISRFYTVGGKYYSMGEFDFPAPQQITT